jgi:hypothetical protein
MTMPQRILAFLLFGVLALVAFDGFERRSEPRDSAPSTTSTTTDDSGMAMVMDGTNGAPPGPYREY